MTVKTRSEKQQEKLDRFSQEADIPDDVQDCWHEVAKRAQAACTRNNGYGLLTITVVVNRTSAVMWLPPGLEKIEPARLIDGIEISPETLAGLAILASKNGHRE